MLQHPAPLTRGQRIITDQTDGVTTRYAVDGERLPPQRERAVATCVSFAPGHHVHRIQARLALITPSDAYTLVSAAEDHVVVRDVDGSTEQWWMHDTTAAASALLLAERPIVHLHGHGLARIDRTLLHPSIDGPADPCCARGETPVGYSAGPRRTRIVVPNRDDLPDFAGTKVWLCHVCHICQRGLVRGYPGASAFACEGCLKIDRVLARRHGALPMTPLDPTLASRRNTLFYRRRDRDETAQVARRNDHHLGRFIAMQARAAGERSGEQLTGASAGSEWTRTIYWDRWQSCFPPGPEQSAGGYRAYIEAVHPWVAEVEPLADDIAWLRRAAREGV